MVPLKCAACGAGLEIREAMIEFTCAYCGVSQIVERSGGTISLKRVGEAIRKVQLGTDRTAAELALPRLKDELEMAEKERLQRLEQALDNLPTSVNWSPLVCVLSCCGLGIFAVVLFVKGHWVWGSLVGFPALISGCDRLDQSPRVLTKEGVKDLEIRKKYINAEMDKKIARLRAQLAAQRKVLDEG